MQPAVLFGRPVARPAPRDPRHDHLAPSQQQIIKRGKWLDGGLLELVQAVLDGRETYRSAASKVGVVRSTIERRVKGLVRDGEIVYRVEVAK